MTTEQPEVLSNTASELASGTPIQHEVNSVGDSAPVSGPSSLPQAGPATTTNDNGEGEQALESHEVIELQTFSERKAWIEEKIKVNSPEILRGSYAII